MKKIILSCMAVLAVSLFSTVVFAVTTHQAVAISTAIQHLHKQGYSSSGAAYIEQVTDKSYVVMKEYVVGNPESEYPCHALVAVDKKTGAINMRSQDASIKLDFDYADTFPMPNTKIYLVCAD